jgi:adenosine deaminase
LTRTRDASHWTFVAPPLRAPTPTRPHVLPLTCSLALILTPPSPLLNQVIEIRFCPALHTAEGLTAQRAVGAACRGFARGCEELGGVGNPVIGGIILCALRNLDEAHGVEMAELAAANLGRGVIGWDLAAEEGPHPMAKHDAGLRRAVELGVPCTAHAGEWGSGQKTATNPYLYTKAGHVDSVPNILFAVDGGCARLGHAITLPLDTSLLRRVADAAVTIECCLSSNRKRIGGILTHHPIREMLEAGCACTLNTDNRFLTNTTLTEEHVAFVREVRVALLETGGRGSALVVLLLLLLLPHCALAF